MSSWETAIWQCLNLDQEQLIMCQTAAHVPILAVCCTSYCSSLGCCSICYLQISILAWHFCSNYHQRKDNVFKLLSVFISLIHRDEPQAPCRSRCFVQVYRGITMQIYIYSTCLKFSLPSVLTSDYFNAFEILE